MQLDDSNLPLHERLANAVEAAIATGQFQTGSRLPTHRQLAQQFSVSIGSVTRAIDTLSARGVVRGEIGRGTFVLEQGDSDDGGVVDLTVNAPPPVVPLARLNEASLMANRQALGLAHGGYVDPSGTERQRAVIADWLSQSRTALKADDILLCNGAQQGLHLAFAVLQPRSNIILTETATFPGALAAAANLGMSMAPVAIDDEGMLPTALAQALETSGARIIYTTPVCQNPLGFETGPARRRELATIARRYDAMIIEDDIYGVYAAKGRLTYRELAPERVFYVTSLSKSVTPLVREGVIAPPPELMAAVRKRLRAECWGLPPYIGELAAAMIETGLAGDAASALREEARARVALTQDLLGLGAVPMPDGAPHVWLAMDPLKAEQFARRASEAGVRITPPSATQVGEAPVSGVRLCIMAPAARATLTRALKIIAGILGSDEDVVV
ncbi:PLP-dependent aminotransferase family protein [Devosia sp. BSSL-BM10]|uniref:PLP-dependent aminotransferase family protein n=1 Tax=Devosia litorisediminis TaxID=2829817 RepID=A0A942E826_9HYPH|nr:PLP-dependent aminotransferase family protein [Devosia litorisediminis]MBS3847559.1 PLP-dependent aminotransferase family protein [Devosia litorisediminis]